MFGADLRSIESHWLSLLPRSAHCILCTLGLEQLGSHTRSLPPRKSIIFLQSSRVDAFSRSLGHRAVAHSSNSDTRHHHLLDGRTVTQRSSLFQVLAYFGRIQRGNHALQPSPSCPYSSIGFSHTIVKRSQSCSISVRWLFRQSFQDTACSALDTMA